MPEYTLPGRKRGRPRAGSSDARERILAAAVDEFAEHGYDAATIRGIAARAGVDSALVHHHFGAKADLFGAAVDVPFRPDLAVAQILTGPRREIGTRLARYVLEAWEDRAAQKRGVLLLRSAIGNRLTTPLLAGFLNRELLGPLAASTGASDGPLRASLVASQIAGLLVTRYLVRLPALADAPVDVLVERIGPTLQRYLDG